MNIEREIVSYLSTYGNTRETDLIGYCIQNHHCSPPKMKKIVDRMVIKGKIYRIVHNRLKPPEVYISLEELVYPEIMRDLLRAQVYASEGEDAHTILKEAAVIAEQRAKDESSRSEGS